MHTLNAASHRLALPCIALVGLLVLGAGGSQTADSLVAGMRLARPLDAVADQIERAKARGRTLSSALGLPGVVSRAERIVDAFDHRTYDEATSVDAAGRDVAIARFDLDGRVAMAASLGWHGAASRPIDAGVALGRALGFARSAGLEVHGRPDIRASTSAGGWSLSWARVAAGVPVRGDGLRIVLWADGTFHGLAGSERALAPAPGVVIGEGAARSAAAGVISREFGALSGQLRPAAMERAWIAPNGAFTATPVDAPDAPLRLAWIARFDAEASLADRVRSVEVWIDAGDGRTLGGDVVE